MSGATRPASVAVPKVFISYRREETAAHAGRVHDAMVAEFGEGNVFIDVDLAPGIDFVERITEVVAFCHVLIVVVGPRWASVTNDDGGARIADPEDFVRLEVETALERDDVTVIPVLVGGARMPSRDDLPPEVRPITRRNALELSDQRWRYDVGRLISRLRELLAGPGSVAEPVAEPSVTSVPSVRLLAEGVALAALAGIVGGGLADSIFGNGLSDLEGVLKRVATWIPVALALGIWLTLRVGDRTALGRRVALALLVGVLAAAASGEISALPDKASDAAIPAFAVLGAGIGCIVGALWAPPRVAIAVVAGLVAGVLVGLVIPAGDWAPVLAVGLRALTFVFLALGAVLIAGGRGTASRASAA